MKTFKETMTLIGVGIVLIIVFCVINELIN
jgi:hypothetical protein